MILEELSMKEFEKKVKKIKTVIIPVGSILDERVLLAKSEDSVKKEVSAGLSIMMTR